MYTHTQGKRRREDTHGGGGVVVYSDMFSARQCACINTEVLLLRSVLVDTFQITITHTAIFPDLLSYYNPFPIPRATQILSQSRDCMP